MYVHGRYGSIYVSLWPSEHNPIQGWSSPGKVHFINGDRLWDGSPQWASKPLEGLDEAAIVKWWSKTQSDPLINYKHKRPFQLSNIKESAFQWATDSQYRILNNQCSTTVLGGLLAGSSPALKARIGRWLAFRGIFIGPIELPSWSIPSMALRAAGTISPTDIKQLVISIWHDSDFNPSLIDRVLSTI
jgi:hypothetical protein